jgi:phosphate butyryltransferase
MLSRISDFDELIRAALEIVKKRGPVKLALAGADDIAALKSVQLAVDLGLITPVLIGNSGKIKNAATAAGVDYSRFEIVNDLNLQRSLSTAVRLVVSGEADLLMRGAVASSDFLFIVAQDNLGFKKSGRVWSHVGVFLPKALGRFLIVSDGWINVAPDLEIMPDIIANAVCTARALGIEKPRVALLSGVELVYPGMAAAIMGAVMAKMSDRGQIGDCVVDGPLSFDVALYEDVAREKKVRGEVAGKADVVITNTIEAGHTLYKTITLYGNSQSAGLVIGGKSPIILNSRYEPADSRVNSIALAILLQQNKKAI